MEGRREAEEFTWVARKPFFGLPTACPNCLPVYIDLKVAHVPFQLAFNSAFPDSDQIPYFAYNNKNREVIETLKQDGIINLVSQFQSLPEYETSVLWSKLLEHNNLVRYAERLKSEFLEASSSSTSATLRSFPSSSFSRKSSRPKNKPKREKTEEEKKIKKRARFFPAAEFITVFLYLSVMGGRGSDELEFEDEV